MATPYTRSSASLNSRTEKYPFLQIILPVSYTHLDVYKRQVIVVDVFHLVAEDGCQLVLTGQ